MADTYTTTITLPPNLLAQIRQEQEATGNTLSSIIRSRIRDSYLREAADLGENLTNGEEAVSGSLEAA